MNLNAVRAIYLFEMHRTLRTLWCRSSPRCSPPCSTSSCSAGVIGSRIHLSGGSYGAFIVPGLAG